MLLLRTQAVDMADAVPATTATVLEAIFLEFPELKKITTEIFYNFFKKKLRLREGEQRGKKQQQRFQRFVEEHTTVSTSTTTTVQYALVLLLQGRSYKTAEKTTMTTTVCPRRDDVHPGRLGRPPGNQKRTFQACDFLNFLEHLRYGQKERVGLDKQKPGLIRMGGKGVV
jgi:hypothetical protein